MLSSLRFDVKKKLRQEMQDSNTNGLSNDTMGQALRANNEDELGKLYEPRRTMQRELVARKDITAEEIRRMIPQNDINQPVIEDKNQNDG